MLKNISNLGTILNKKQQKSIKGGGRTSCVTNLDCFIATGDFTDRCINRFCFFY